MLLNYSEAPFCLVNFLFLLPFRCFNCVHKLCNHKIVMVIAKNPNVLKHFHLLKCNFLGQKRSKTPKIKSLCLSVVHSPSNEFIPKLVIVSGIIYSNGHNSRIKFFVFRSCYSVEDFYSNGFVLRIIYSW